MTVCNFDWKTMKPSQIVESVEFLVGIIQKNDIEGARFARIQLKKCDEHLCDMFKALGNTIIWKETPEYLRQAQDLVSFKMQLETFKNHMSTNLFSLMEKVLIDILSVFPNNNEATPQYIALPHSKKTHDIVNMQSEARDIAPNALVDCLRALKENNHLPARELEHYKRIILHLRKHLSREHLLASFVASMDRQLQLHYEKHREAAVNYTSLPPLQSGEFFVTFKQENGIAKSFKDIRPQIVTNDDNQKKFIDKNSAKHARKHTDWLTWYRHSILHKNHKNHVFNRNTQVKQFVSNQYQFGNTPSERAALIAIRVAVRGKWKELIAWGDNIFVSDLKALCDTHDIKLRVLNEKQRRQIEYRAQNVSTTTNANEPQGTKSNGTLPLSDSAFGEPPQYLNSNKALPLHRLMQ